MIRTLEKILRKPCKDVSSITEVDLNSKKVDLLRHTVMLVEAAISHKDLTDTSMDSGVSRSQLSKLDTGRPYEVFVEIFYELVYPYIMGHNYSLYRRFLSIIGIDSTFICTMVKGSGKYRRQKTENGIKVHEAAVVFPLTVPLESMMTPANLNDSPEFDDLLSGIDPDLVKQSIITFDLGYYDLDRFMDLKGKGIRFVTRIKKNASYTVIKEYAHSSIIRFRNGPVLRHVSMEIDGKQRDYLTDILDLPDIYIHWIYSQRWNIETFFRTMKTYLKMDHLISRKMNGILVQIFAAMIAYIVLMMIRDMISYGTGIPEIIRLVRHGMELPLKNRETGKVSAMV